MTAGRAAIRPVAVRLDLDDDPDPSDVAIFCLLARITSSPASSTSASGAPTTRIDAAFRVSSGGETIFDRDYEEGGQMADPVPAGSDVSAGTYKCTKCGYELTVGSTKHLPPCPECSNGEYETVRGGDSVNDPYPSTR